MIEKIFCNAEPGRLRDAQHGRSGTGQSVPAGPTANAAPRAAVPSHTVSHQTVRLIAHITLGGDSVDSTVAAHSNLALSGFISGNSGPVTIHPLALQPSYLSSNGNFTASNEAAAFGDSSTDG